MDLVEIYANSDWRSRLRLKIEGYTFTDKHLRINICGQFFGTNK